MLKLIKRDFQKNYIHILIKLIIFAIVFIIVGMANTQDINNLMIYENGKMIEAPGNYMNLFFNLFANYIKYNNLPPIFWILINTYIIFIIGNYIETDFKKEGQLVLPRISNINKYYISKIFYVIINVLIYYSVILFAFIISGLFLKDKSFSFSKALFSKVLVNEANITIENPIIFIGTCFFVYILTSITLCLIYVISSFFFNEILITIGIIAIIMLPVFINNFFLIGGYSIILRQNFAGGHNNSLLSAVYLTIINMLTIIIGRRFIKKKDVF